MRLWKMVVVVVVVVVIVMVMVMVMAVALFRHGQVTVCRLGIHTAALYGTVRV